MKGEAVLALPRLALRLAARQWPRFIFFAACLSLGTGFLIAISHLLAAVDKTVALRAREMLAGDIEVSSGRDFSAREREQFAILLTRGRREALSVSFSSMLTTSRAAAPFLVSVKSVESAYPLRGILKTDPPGGTTLLAGGGKCLVERALALQHELKPGERVKLGALVLTIAGVIDREPDRNFAAFSFAPRLMIAAEDLERTRLLGLGARTRFRWTMALSDEENSVAASKAVKFRLERALPEPHLSIESYTEGEPAMRDGLRRSALFFTVLSLAALLLGAAGLRAGLTLFLDSQAETMGLLRCLGASSREVERLYAGLCVGAGLAGGLGGAILGWGTAALGATWAPRFGVDLTVPPDPAAFLEAALLSAALAWGLSAARVRALAVRSPLDALRAPPEAPRRLVAAGWAAAGAAVLFAAWRRSGSNEDAVKLTAALAAGALAVEILSRLALRVAAWLSEKSHSLCAPLPVRHGMRRLARRPGPSRVMLFTLAGGFAMLAAVGTAREGLSRALSPASTESAADLFMVDVQPSQLEAARKTAARRAKNTPDFSPLVRARLTLIDGRPVTRGDPAKAGNTERERGRLRVREYNLTYADALNPSEKVVASEFWKPGGETAEASVEKGFLERAGLELGSLLTFDIQGREVSATVTSVREVEWAAMRPNFFVTLTPSLLSAAPQTYIGSLRSKSPADAAALRVELARNLANVSVIDAGSLLARVRETLNLLLAAIGALAGFCVLTGAFVVGGLVALDREERAADAALERALGWSARETLLADTAELGTLGVLSGLAAAATAVGLGWAVAKRLSVPFAADPREAALLFTAAALLPVLVGLLAGTSGRRAAVMDALRRDF